MFELTSLVKRNQLFIHSNMLKLPPGCSCENVLGRACKAREIFASETDLPLFPSKIK